MPAEFYPLIASLLYYLYLVDPITSEPPAQELFKAIQRQSLLVDKPGDLFPAINSPFSSLPLMFILMALLANKIS